ncbi:MAG: EAL domain-containing protein [Alphaproteobacteria bacterium]|nr:MAG: EAL domain-containing protein [Alphaproteobacteria bacterium]
MRRFLFAALTWLFVLTGLEGLAHAAAREVNLSGPQTAIDLTFVLTQHQIIDNETEVSAVLNSYPEGTAYYVDLYNDTDTETNRLLVFSFPLLMKSSLLGPSLQRPHVADILVLSGQAAVEVLPTGMGDVYGAASVRIPAGEQVRIGFSHEGSIDGTGVYLWQPASFSEFSSYRIWSNGIFLGIASLLVAFGLGVALVSWASREGYQLALLITAWVLEYVTLGASVDGFWRAITLSLFALAALSYVLAHVEQPKGILANSRLLAAVRILLLVPFGMALFQMQSAMSLIRLEVTGLGALLGLLVFLPSSPFGILRGSVRFGLQILFVTGALMTVLPLFDWRSGALVIEPLLHGLFLVSLCLLVFPSILGLRRLEPSSFAPPVGTAADPRAPAPAAPIPAAVTDPLLRTEDRYALGIAASHQGLWDWHIDGDRLYLSPSIDGMLGLASGGMERSELGWAKRVHPEDLDRYRNALRSYIERGNVSFSLEFRMRHEDGSFPWMQLRATCMPGPDGLAERVVGVVSDITPTRMLQERLAHNASRDTLTELPNRHILLEETKQAIEASDGRHVPALLIIDLDRFKTINDGLGHAMGDLLLQILARRISAAVGEGDFVARIGGDEFGLLLAHGTADAPGRSGGTVAGPRAEELADQLIDLLAQPVDLDEAEIFPNASIGVAYVHEAHERPEQLLREAELAMFRAKRAGGGRYVVYQEHMGRSGSKALSLETDLRRALSRKQIEIHYQPIMNLKDGAIAGFEALMRWRHPIKGLLVPDEFVAIAEETDMIVPLGRFALSMASLQLAEWQKQYLGASDLFVSVNVSARQLMRADFCEDVADVMRNAELAEGTLKLEVTESLIMQDPDLAEEQLVRSRDLGAGVSLDDFGTGFASLANLQRFPFDTIKIDRSFVTTMESRPDSPVIVNSIVSLAKDLSLIVIAEGLETEDNALYLRQLGCEFGQGYVFGAPMTATEAETFLEHHLKKR